MEIGIKRVTNCLELPPSRERGFGKYHTDHFFQARFTQKRLWHDEEIRPFAALSLDPSSFALQFGFNLFDSLRVYGQENGLAAAFRPHDIYARFAASGARLGMVVPPRDLFINAISQISQADLRWMPETRGASLYARCNLMRIDPTIGKSIDPEFLFTVVMSPLGSYGRKPLAVKASSAPRSFLMGYGDLKIGINYSVNSVGVDQAKAEGFDQVLWLRGENSLIEELNALNIFFVFKDEIITPALNGAVVPGIMRDSVIKILSKRGLRVVERDISINLIEAAGANGDLMEVFGSGTATNISPIAKISYRDSVITPRKNQGDLTQSVYEELINIQVGSKSTFSDWMFPLEQKTN